MLPSNSLGPGLGEVGQGGLIALHLRHHSQKIRTPNQKNVFSLETTRLAKSLASAPAIQILLGLRLHSPGTDRSLGKIRQLSDPAQDTRVLTITNEHL